MLYPLGVASELTMVYLALPYIRSSRKWSIHLPNTVNFAFDYYYFCLFAVVVYIPGMMPRYGTCLVPVFAYLVKSGSKNPGPYASGH